MPCSQFKTFKKWKPPKGLGSNGKLRVSKKGSSWGSFGQSNDWSDTWGHAEECIVEKTLFSQLDLNNLQMFADVDLVIDIPKHGFCLNSNQSKCFIIILYRWNMRANPRKTEFRIFMHQRDKMTDAHLFYEDSPIEKKLMTGRS